MLDGNAWPPEIRRASCEAVYAQVSTGQIDAGLTIKKLKYPGTETRQVFEERLLVLAASGLFPERKQISVEELDPSKELRIASRADPSVGWDLAFQQWHEAVFSSLVSPAVFAGSFSILTHFLGAPRTWAVMPAFLARHYADISECHILEMQEQAPLWHGYFVTKEHLAEPKKAQIQWLLRNISPDGTDEPEKSADI